MKKKSVILMTAIMGLSLTACGNQNAATTPTTEAATVTVEATTEEGTQTEEPAATEEESSVQIDNGEEAEYEVTIDMQEDTQEITNDDDVVMLKVTQSFPDVTIDGSAAAADNINDYYTKEKESFEALINETKEIAEEDYGMRSEEEQKNWNPYELATEYSVVRSDDQCISIVNDSYNYTGGAHPNGGRLAANFDTASGELLTFEDLFSDVDKAKEFVTDYLLNEMKDEKYEGMFFDDYEKDVPTILDDNTWYLSDEGFVVICNEYIVSPHAAGIMEFTIPYGDFTELSDQYKPTTK